MARDAYVSLDQHPYLANERRLAVTPMESLQRAAPFEEAIASHLELDKLASLVETAVDSLSALDRDILIAVVFERLTFRQIADRLGISKSNAHWRYGRSLRKLQDWFKDWAIATVK
jgi:RNA polymerase sigma factor (sigma-70 family)